MLKSDLKFDYPEILVATERKLQSRVMVVQGGEPSEISEGQLLTMIGPDDILVLNETKVIPARIFSEEGLEVLFIHALEDNQWQVLCPARRWPKGKDLHLPGGVQLKLVKTGLPQIVETSSPLDENYFFEHGDMPLPPYIQEARGDRRSRDFDRDMYQTDWADKIGSLAAPTASLHFTNDDIDKVRNRGAQVAKICLHVGLGTFLPIHADDLNDHKMHSEFVNVSCDVWDKVQDVKKNGGKVWALGSTVTRALESVAHGKLEKVVDTYQGGTDLFIKPGFEYKAVDVLMTNFHQPESTLLAMVMAFCDIETTKNSYQWAIERKFRLFSYGDLSVWMK